MAKQITSYTFDLFSHPRLHQIWLILCLTVPWLCLAVDPYLWALVSLSCFYISAPLLLMAGLKFFMVRHDPTLRRRARRATFTALFAAVHLLLHLLWVIQTDWRF
ncbi:MAG: hypothetical protein C0624_06195 [Desulfuromonas sp.]|nr:MAG: hypothetical protein C0624_06195 [Desulfuromonas sp.]